jgi:hypothetical protein
VFSSFETARFLQFWSKFENMSNVSEPNSEHPLDPPRAQTEAESRRRAECAERISRLLSALDGGSSPGKTEYLPKGGICEPKSNPDSETSLRFLLMDKTGPIGEFGSREGASKCKNDLQDHAANIIGVEKKPLEPGANREQPTDRPAGITAEFNSTNRGAIQELKKADDQGDSNRNSPQGAVLPANPTAMRIVGKICSAAAKTVTLNARPQFLTNPCELLVLGNASAQATNAVGSGNQTLTCAPSAAQYQTINIHYTTELTNPS